MAKAELFVILMLYRNVHDPCVPDGLRRFHPGFSKDAKRVTMWPIQRLVAIIFRRLSNGRHLALTSFRYFVHTIYSPQNVYSRDEIKGASRTY